MTTKTMRTVIVSQGFRGNIVTIAGRKYEVEKLTKTSQRRLHAVLESVPAANRCVELESDFTPTVYLFFYKTKKPTLAEQQSSFIAAMVASGKGWSDLTPAEHAEAARLGFCRRLPVVAAPRPMPECVTYRELEMAWW